MAKKSKKAAQKRNVKWAQIMFLVLGALVALSMIISSVFAFSGSAPQAAPPTLVLPTAITTPAP